MNSIETLNVDYLKSYRTIETISIAKDKMNKILFVYNYEGNSFRIFQTHFGLINFFKDEDVQADYHFTSEEALDDFLINYSIIN